MRIFKWIAITVACIMIGLLAAYPPAMFFLLTGRLFPASHIEGLKHPVQVAGWTVDGLQLDDGSLVKVPGFKSLPASSQGLAEATRPGIEIDARGHVYGLVKVWHWCGNDPLRKDIRRIDLGLLLAFLRQGKSSIPVSDDDPRPLSPDGTFTEYGWSISDYVAFRHFVQNRAHNLPK